MLGRYVLWVGNDARFDATLFACLGKSHCAPRSPRVLFLKPGMFRRAGIVQRINDRFREGFVRRGVANGLGRGGDRRGYSRSCPGYLTGRKGEGGKYEWMIIPKNLSATRTARASSLSSIVLSASVTASPTLTPPFLSSSAAARSRGFSLMLEVSCIKINKHPHHEIHGKEGSWGERQRK